jgi:phenylpyruvate tautomerase PptA (4-oxalocrotonate tautomerase family)
MPIYTCTVAESTLSADTKRALAGEIARIHSDIVHVPTTYVNVAFHELAADGLTDGQPASPVLVTGWVRERHPADDTTRLATPSPRSATSTRNACSSSSHPVQLVSPWKAAVSCLSQVMSRPGSPEVEGERYQAMPERLTTT